MQRDELLKIFIILMIVKMFREQYSLFISEKLLIDIFEKVIDKCPIVREFLNDKEIDLNRYVYEGFLKMYYGLRDNYYDVSEKINDVYEMIENEFGSDVIDDIVKYVSLVVCYEVFY